MWGKAREQFLLYIFPLIETQQLGFLLCLVNLFLLCCQHLDGS